MNKRTFTINDLPVAERPRERFKKYGADALSAQEILALILGRGINGESVIVTAQNLLIKFGSLRNISQASIEELQTISGIGLAKSIQLKASFELADRVDNEMLEQNKRINIRSAEDVYKILKRKIAAHKKEYFVVMSLDSRNNLLGYDIVSVGTLNESLVHPRETFEAAINRKAASIILAHNHPSGDTEPSQADIEITRKIKHSGNILGIKVIDHIIITRNKWSSLEI